MCVYVLPVRDLLLGETKPRFFLENKDNILGSMKGEILQGHNLKDLKVIPSLLELNKSGV
jgi:hypothetical protein